MPTTTAATPTTPAAHHWAPGQRARIRAVHFDARTWDVGKDWRSRKAVTLEPGDVVTLTRKASGCTGDEWHFRTDRHHGELIVDEATIEPITGGNP